VTSETTPVVSAAQHNGAEDTAAHNGAADTVVLTGNDLTVDQVVAVARHRAPVAVSAAALRQVWVASRAPADATSSAISRSAPASTRASRAARSKV